MKTERFGAVWLPFGDRRSVCCAAKPLPGAGLEPAWPFGQGILSVIPLPTPSTSIDNNQHPQHNIRPFPHASWLTVFDHG